MPVCPLSLCRCALVALPTALIFSSTLALNFPCYSLIYNISLAFFVSLYLLLPSFFSCLLHSSLCLYLPFLPSHVSSSLPWHLPSFFLPLPSSFFFTFYVYMYTPSSIFLSWSLEVVEGEGGVEWSRLPLGLHLLPPGGGFLPGHFACREGLWEQAGFTACLLGGTAGQTWAWALPALQGDLAALLGDFPGGRLGSEMNQNFLWGEDLGSSPHTHRRLREGGGQNRRCFTRHTSLVSIAAISKLSSSLLPVSLSLLWTWQALFILHLFFWHVRKCVLLLNKQTKKAGEGEAGTGGDLGLPGVCLPCPNGEGSLPMGTLGQL